MAQTVTSKLVRDLVPQIILFMGEIPKIRVAPPGEYRKLLRDKLVEEVHEFLKTEDVDELVDIMEVVLASASDLRVGPAELEERRLTKVRERGAFAARIVWMGND